MKSKPFNVKLQSEVIYREEALLYSVNKENRKPLLEAPSSISLLRLFAVILLCAAASIAYMVTHPFTEVEIESAYLSEINNNGSHVNKLETLVSENKIGRCNLAWKFSMSGNKAKKIKKITIMHNEQTEIYWSAGDGYVYLFPKNGCEQFNVIRLARTNALSIFIQYQTIFHVFITSVFQY